jgi:Zn finger protein HypA/HybF involved in hydrogenase expression
MTNKIKCMDWDGKGTKAWRFFCPGCQEYHTPTEGWSFNGDVERPTFTPSILVRSGHYMEGHEGDCWCTYNAKHLDNPSSFKCHRCHSYVTDGKIQYLGDCSHALAGQTVELPGLEN